MSAEVTSPQRTPALVVVILAIVVTANRADFERMSEIFGTTSAPSRTVGDLKLADFGVEELVPFLKKHNFGL